MAEPKIKNNKIFQFIKKRPAFTLFLFEILYSVAAINGNTHGADITAEYPAKKW